MLWSSRASASFVGGSCGLDLLSELGDAAARGKPEPAGPKLRAEAKREMMSRLAAIPPLADDWQPEDPEGKAIWTANTKRQIKRGEFIQPPIPCALTCRRNNQSRSRSLRRRMIRRFIPS